MVAVSALVPLNVPLVILYLVEITLPLVHLVMSLIALFALLWIVVPPVVILIT